MPTRRRPRPYFGNDWLGVVGAAREDLSALPAERPVDQFVQFRDAVLDSLEQPDVVEEVSETLNRLGDRHPNSPVVDLLLKEFAAYRAAVSIAKAQREAGEVTVDAPTSNLARFGKTAIDSFRDIAELSPRLRALLKLFSEVFELFEKKSS